MLADATVEYDFHQEVISSIAYRQTACAYVVDGMQSLDRCRRLLGEIDEAEELEASISQLITTVFNRCEAPDRLDDILDGVKVLPPASLYAAALRCYQEEAKNILDKSKHEGVARVWSALGFSEEKEIFNVDVFSNELRRVCGTVSAVPGYGLDPNSAPRGNRVAISNRFGWLFMATPSGLSMRRTRRSVGEAVCKTVPLTGEVCHLEISPDGQRLAVCETRKLLIFSVADLVQEEAPPSIAVTIVEDSVDDSLSYCGWNPAGGELIVLSSRGKLCLASDKGECTATTFDPIGQPATAAAWSLRGRTILFGVCNGSIRVIDVETQRELRVIPPPDVEDLEGGLLEPRHISYASPSVLCVGYVTKRDEEYASYCCMLKDVEPPVYQVLDEEYHEDIHPTFTSVSLMEWNLCIMGVRGGDSHTIFLMGLGWMEEDDGQATPSWGCIDTSTEGGERPECVADFSRDDDQAVLLGLCVDLTQPPPSEGIPARPLLVMFTDMGKGRLDTFVMSESERRFPVDKYPSLKIKYDMMRTSIADPVAGRKSSHKISPSQMVPNEKPLLAKSFPRVADSFKASDAGGAKVGLNRTIAGGQKGLPAPASSRDGLEGTVGMGAEKVDSAGKDGQRKAEETARIKRLEEEKLRREEEACRVRGELGRSASSATSANSSSIGPTTRPVLPTKTWDPHRVSSSPTAPDHAGHSTQLDPARPLYAGAGGKLPVDVPSEEELRSLAPIRSGTIDDLWDQFANQIASFTRSIKDLRPIRKDAATFLAHYRQTSMVGGDLGISLAKCKARVNKELYVPMRQMQRDRAKLKQDYVVGHKHLSTAEGALFSRAQPDYVDLTDARQLDLESTELQSRLDRLSMLVDERISALEDHLEKCRGESVHRQPTTQAPILDLLSNYFTTICHHQYALDDLRDRFRRLERDHRRGDHPALAIVPPSSPLHASWTPTPTRSPQRTVEWRMRRLKNMPSRRIIE